MMRNKSSVLLFSALMLAIGGCLTALEVVGYVDISVLPSGPANPASGFLRYWVDNSAPTLINCLTSSGAACYFNGAPANLIRICEVVTGDPGSASPALVDDNDAPSVCGNKFGSTLTITVVECYADAGSPTVTPIITGGGSTSILSGALTCGTGSFASGTLNGTPTQTSGQSIDSNITVAGGTAKYIVVRITRTL